MRLPRPRTGLKLPFSRVSAEASRTLSSALANDARVSGSFVVLTLGSGAIATFGVLENSAAVIIGAMIIAPLLAPIQALAYGALGILYVKVLPRDHVQAGVLRLRYHLIELRFEVLAAGIDRTDDPDAMPVPVVNVCRQRLRHAASASLPMNVAEPLTESSVGS